MCSSFLCSVCVSVLVLHISRCHCCFLVAHAPAAHRLDRTRRHSLRRTTIVHHARLPPLLLPVARLPSRTPLPSHRRCGVPVPAGIPHFCRRCVMSGGCVCLFLWLVVCFFLCVCARASVSFGLFALLLCSRLLTLLLRLCTLGHSRSLARVRLCFRIVRRAGATVCAPVPHDAQHVSLGAPAVAGHADHQSGARSCDVRVMLVGALLFFLTPFFSLF